MPGASHAAHIEVRSYRGVFDFERRVYRIDRIQLNPGGVPMRGVLHLIAALGLFAALSKLPLTGTVLVALPWTVRWLAAPVAIAVLATALRIDGRPLHKAIPSLVGFALGARRLAGFGPAPRRAARWRPGPVVIALDGSGPRLPTLTYSGPGLLVVRAPHLRSERRRRRSPALVYLEAVAARPRVRGLALVIGGGVRVVTDSRKRPAA